MAEAIKAGSIMDAAFFADLEAQADAAREGSLSALSTIIDTAVALKVHLALEVAVTRTARAGSGRHNCYAYGKRELTDMQWPMACTRTLVSSDGSHIYHPLRT